MRTDCERDKRETQCVNAMGSGPLWGTARPGNWIAFKRGPAGGLMWGRVIGGVTADGSRMIEVAAFFGASVNVRWILAEDVRKIMPNPPANVFQFLCGDWFNSADLIARMEHGFRTDFEPDLKATLEFNQTGRERYPSTFKSTAKRYGKES